MQALRYATGDGVAVVRYIGAMDYSKGCGVLKLRWSGGQEHSRLVKRRAIEIMLRNVKHGQTHLIRSLHTHKRKREHTYTYTET